MAMPNRGADLHTLRSHQMASLHMAMAHRNVDPEKRNLVSFVIDQGADPLAVTEKGEWGQHNVQNGSYPLQGEELKLRDNQQLVSARGVDEMVIGQISCLHYYVNELLVVGKSL